MYVKKVPQNFSTDEPEGLSSTASHCRGDHKLKQGGIYMMAGAPTMEDVPVESA